MSNYASEVPPENKKRKVTNESSPSWSSLPDAVALSCVAHVPRSDYATISLVSKSHRSLVASPELCRARTLIGCTEQSFYVCLRSGRDPTPRWFILTGNRSLKPITSNPYQPPESSSFVVVDWGIYVIGGLINGKPTSDVLFLDCYSNTWRRVPSMKMPRASASASFVDRKIYVFGGCGEDADSSNWAEVFDPKMKDPNLGGTTRDSMPGNRNEWCAIGKLLYCLGTRGKILWCEPDELDWKEVKGLEKLQTHVPPLGSFFHSKLLFKGAEISKLCSNSEGNIVIFWNTLLGDPKYSRLGSTEISLERREGGEIWGKIEWSGVVFKVDPLSPPYTVKCGLNN
ncbi:hypothetical protein AALP_AA7G244000 [Arabis alpina]|uniref:Uncharacterized protein n=1 Tax=Arabis alpina TaxID=50452 RepID=A0A087GK99_ARAAL|nr:hypothetical protein AALP_AA7G244000 [Arabis alpina]